MKLSVLRRFLAMGLVALALPLFAQTPLISTGAIWKYLDTGSFPGNAWTSQAFDDSTWLSGPAQLGYGDGDEATRLNGGPSPNVFLAYYFRHRFDVANPATVSNLVVRVLRDDGVVVYLNGFEVFRNNMPAGPITSSTLASDIVNSPQESQFYSRRISPALLHAGANLLAVEVHQGNTTSSDLSFDLELLPNAPTAAPAVAITAPADNTDYVAPVDPLLTASATDFDGIVTNVTFTIDGAAVGRTTTEPYSLVCSNHSVGMHVLHAVATDDAGLSTTSAPVRIRVLAPPLVLNLVTNGAYWRYLDDGSDPGPAWRTAGFSDSAWLFNRAEFGYGDQDETTTIDAGVPLTITHYFRHKFAVARATDFTNLLFRVLRDDGVVVYLNNVEAFRMNMPLGPIDRFTPASAPVGSTNETFFFPTNVRATLLVDGVNTLAVELHQTSSTIDASFDLSLTAIGPPAAPVRLSIDQDGAKTLLRWTDPQALLEQAPVSSAAWATVTNAASPYEVPAGPSRLFRLRTPRPIPQF